METSQAVRSPLPPACWSGDLCASHPGSLELGSLASEDGPSPGHPGPPSGARSPSIAPASCPANRKSWAITGQSAQLHTRSPRACPTSILECPPGISKLTRPNRGSCSLNVSTSASHLSARSLSLKHRQTPGPRPASSLCTHPLADFIQSPGLLNTSFPCTKSRFYSQLTSQHLQAGV